MKTYKITNPAGLGFSTKEKIASAAERFNTNYKIIGGEYAAYGNPEYSIIETDEVPTSDFIRVLEWNTNVIEL